jgi:hypothetical protein
MLFRAKDEHVFRFDGSDPSPVWASYREEEYVEEGASSDGIPAAQVFDEFRGPEGRRVLCDGGLLQSDRRHPTAERARITAGLVHDFDCRLAGSAPRRVGSGAAPGPSSG